MSGARNAGASASLWVSQNYLTSSHTIQKLIDRANLLPTDHVIEIGPGKGHITRALLQRCGRVTAVELDDGLYNRLLSSLATAENLDLHHQDFMEWPLPVIGNYKVFSNIPFNRTTDIVRKLTEHCNPPQEAWLVMEKGAAKRFMGKPRETLRSLLLKPYFELEIAYHFRREDFHPLPSVDIVLLHITKKVQPDVDLAERAAYARFVAAGMNQGLRALSGFMPKELFNSAIHKTGLGVSTAPGDILYIQWLCLYRCGPDCHSGTVKNRTKTLLQSAGSMKRGPQTSVSKP